MFRTFLLRNSNGTGSKGRKLPRPVRDLSGLAWLAVSKKTVIHIQTVEVHRGEEQLVLINEKLDLLLTLAALEQEQETQMSLDISALAASVAEIDSTVDSAVLVIDSIA